MMKLGGLAFLIAVQFLIPVAFAKPKAAAKAAIAPAPNEEPAAPLPVEPIPEIKHPMLAYPIPSLQDSREGQKEVTTLTLAGSVAQALASATTVQKAVNQKDLTGDQLLQGYAQFLPNLIAVGTSNKANGVNYYTMAGPTLVQSSNYGPAYQLTATLNLFNGLSDLAGLKAALARNTVADLSLKRAKQQIALDVAQSYLQVILDQDLVKIAKENLSSSQAREALLSEQTRVGVRNLADFYRQQAQTSSDETYLVNAESKERTDELMLLRKLRLDATQNYKLIPPHLEQEGRPNAYQDEDEMVKTALANRADLAASERTANAASWDVTGARGSYFPRLDFGGSVSASARWLDSLTVNGNDSLPATQLPFNDQLSHQVNYTVGLTLTWTLFDRWMTEANVERAKVTARNARLDHEDFYNQVIAEVRQAYGDYRTVLQQLESTKKGDLAARKAYEVMAGRYQVGSASFVDLTTAQAVLVQAEAARAQALIGLALQIRALETALGTVDVP